MARQGEAVIYVDTEGVQYHALVTHVLGGSGYPEGPEGQPARTWVNLVYIGEGEADAYGGPRIMQKTIPYGPVEGWEGGYWKDLIPPEKPPGDDKPPGEAESTGSEKSPEN